MDLVVVAKSICKELVIGRKIIIKKVETFQDLMNTTKTVEQKKAKILDLFRNKDDLMIDDKFGFNLTEVFYLMDLDCQFYLDSMKIIQHKIPYNDRLYQIAYDHRETFLTDS